jgi:hypothetical protein
MSRTILLLSALVAVGISSEALAHGGSRHAMQQRSQFLRTLDPLFAPCKAWADKVSKREGRHYRKVQTCIEAGGPGRMKD